MFPFQLPEYKAPDIMLMIQEKFWKAQKHGSWIIDSCYNQTLSLSSSVPHINVL